MAGPNEHPRRLSIRRTVRGLCWTGGCPLILLDQELSPELPIFRYGALRLALTEGATRREAEDLAAFPNARVHSLVYVGEDPAEATSEDGG